MPFANDLAVLTGLFQLACSTLVVPAHLVPLELELVDVEDHPGEVAHEEGGADAAEDGDEALLLPRHRLHAVQPVVVDDCGGRTQRLVQCNICT